MSYQGIPHGKIKVVDPSPYNWLYILFHTIEEAVRANHEGRIAPSLAEDFKWINEVTLEVKLRKAVLFHDGQSFSTKDVERNFLHLQQWSAPHPPGTWLNFSNQTQLEVIDNHTFRMHFSKPDGLALGKLRSNHFANLLFWQNLGFGYAKLGTGEGHW